MLCVPIEVIHAHARRNKLPYKNLRDFDHAWNKPAPPLIPLLIRLWAEDGINLSEQFAFDLWDRLANKKAGKKEGELMRTYKLMNDALRGLHDISAWAAYCGLQAVYVPREDVVNARDLKLIVPDLGPVWVQMAVRTREDVDTKIKEQRARGRGVKESNAIKLTAGRKDLDQQFNPWLPTPRFYRDSLAMIRGEPF